MTSRPRDGPDVSQPVFPNPLASSFPPLSYPACPASPDLMDHRQREDRQVPGSKHLLTNRETRRNRPGGKRTTGRGPHRKLAFAKRMWPTESGCPARSPIQNKRRPDQNRNKVQHCASQTWATSAHKLHPTFPAHRIETAKRKKRLLEVETHNREK